MKYMHFNSSCSYAGLANMLSFYGFDTEDYEIALAIGLPYLLCYEEKTQMYQAGAMLQSKEWFDLYLNPIGFCFQEQLVSKKEVAERVRKGMMLGMQVSPQSKHAVVFFEKIGENYIFLNNKKETSSEEETLILTKEELVKRMPEEVMLGFIETYERKEVELTPYLEQSLLNWEKLKQEIQEYMQKKVESQELRQAMNRLFRPILVDSLAMMELLSETELVERLKVLQEHFLKVVCKNELVRLCDELDCDGLRNIIEEIIRLVKVRIRC